MSFIQSNTVSRASLTQNHGGCPELALSEEQLIWTMVIQKLRFILLSTAFIAGRGLKNILFPTV